MNYHWNWGIFLEPSPEGNGTYGGMILSGLWMTVRVSVLAWIVAVTAGSAIGILGSLPNVWAKRAAALWIEPLRNIPLLVQLFLWYFVLPEVVPVSWGDWLKQMPDAPFFNATIVPRVCAAGAVSSAALGFAVVTHAVAGCDQYTWRLDSGFGASRLNFFASSAATGGQDEVYFGGGDLGVDLGEG